MNPQLNGPRFIRNVAIMGGTVLAVDVFIPGARPAELVLQAFVVLICGLFGLFRGGGNEDDSGRPA
jgi:hypothetical protein